MLTLLILAVLSPSRLSAAVAPSSVYGLPISTVTGVEPVNVITGATPSDVLTRTLSRAAAFPGVTHVPSNPVNLISKLFPTVAGELFEKEALFMESKAPVFFTVKDARSVLAVVSQSSAVIISSLAA